MSKYRSIAVFIDKTVVYYRIIDKTVVYYRIIDKTDKTVNSLLIGPHLLTKIRVFNLRYFRVFSKIRVFPEILSFDDKRIISDSESAANCCQNPDY